MSIKNCCCNNCGAANCSAARLDCYNVGLRPFSVQIGITMVKASCRRISADEIFCENSSCGSWGESPCGGCVPCDPLGELPGANGRVCPCPNETCEHPPGIHYPYLTCETVDPTLNVDGCRYGHSDYWYLTWNSEGNGGCSLPTVPQCPWVGSHSCAFDLVRIPAGFTEVTCKPLTGQLFNIDVTQLAKCNEFGFWPLPWPTEVPFYGWPHDCEFSPPPCGAIPDSGCMCTCVGVFPTWQLQDEPNYSCDPLGTIRTTLYARINWAVACAADQEFGGILACGDQCPCDTEKYSYVSITFFGTSFEYANNVIGADDFTYVNPDDLEGISTLCKLLVGDPKTTPAGAECSGTPRLNIGTDCSAKCCACQYQETVILRCLRNQNDDTCKLATGDYEVVGIDQCGDMMRFGCENKPCAFNAKCSPSRTWEGALESIGITALFFRIY